MAARGAGGVVLGYVETVEETVDVLHVRDVAAEADDARVGELTDAVDVGEAG